MSAYEAFCPAARQTPILSVHSACLLVQPRRHEVWQILLGGCQPASLSTAIINIVMTVHGASRMVAALMTNYLHWVFMKLKTVQRRVSDHAKEATCLPVPQVYQKHAVL